MVIQKKLDRQLRTKYRNSLDSLEFSQIKPKNLSPQDILTFYLDYRQMMKEDFGIGNLKVFMG